MYASNQLSINYARLRNLWTSETSQGDKLSILIIGNTFLELSERA